MVGFVMKMITEGNLKQGGMVTIVHLFVEW